MTPWSSLTLGPWMQIICHQRANQLAFCNILDGQWNERNLTYAELLAQARGIASYLHKHYAVGSRMVLLYEPGIEFVKAFWACLLAGMVAVPVYPPSDPRTRERFLGIVKKAQASAVLTTQAIEKTIRLVKWFLPAVGFVKWISTDQLPSANFQAIHVDPQAPCLLQFTSGSTGTPRGAILSQANLLHNARLLDATRHRDLLQGPIDPEVFFCWLPLYHDMGLISAVVYPVLIGCPSYLMSPLLFLQRPARWVQGISRYKATISAAPNFAYDLCARKVTPQQVAELDLSSWAVALNGAEPIRPQTLENFNATFGPCGFRPEALYPSYGLAETTVFVSSPGKLIGPHLESFQGSALREGQAIPCSADTPQAETLVSVGYPWLDTDLQIVNRETRQLCQPGQVGEVWLRNGSVASGYWNDPEGSQAVFGGYLDTGEGPYLQTGDQGFIWEKQLYLTGRFKDLIILHGQNWAPQTFELTAETAHPAFRPGCVAAFSVPTPDGEGVVLVQEVRKETQGITSTELQQILKQTLQRQHGVPLHDACLIPAGRLPKTSSGKIQRQRSRELYLKGQLKRWNP